MGGGDLLADGNYRFNDATTTTTFYFFTFESRPRATYLSGFGHFRNDGTSLSVLQIHFILPFPLLAICFFLLSWLLLLVNTFLRGGGTLLLGRAEHMHARADCMIKGWGGLVISVASMPTWG